MKKLFFIAAMTLTLGSFGAVLAANQTLDTTNKDGEVIVQYTLGQSYTITIPDSFDFTAQNTDITKTVSASDVLIRNGSKLKVIIEGENCNGTQWFLADVSDATNKAEYFVKKDATNLKNGDTVLEASAGTQTAEANLVFNLKAGITKAGTYKDTLTFTSSIVGEGE